MSELWSKFCEFLDELIILITLPIGFYLLYKGDITNGLLCLILGEIWGRFEYPANEQTKNKQRS